MHNFQRSNGYTVKLQLGKPIVSSTPLFIFFFFSCTGMKYIRPRYMCPCVSSERRLRESRGLRIVQDVTASTVSACTTCIRRHRSRPQQRWGMRACTAVLSDRHLSRTKPRAGNQPGSFRSSLVDLRATTVDVDDGCDRPPLPLSQQEIGIVTVVSRKWILSRGV